MQLTPSHDREILKSLGLAIEEAASGHIPERVDLSAVSAASFQTFFSNAPQWQLPIVHSTLSLMDRTTTFSRAQQVRILCSIAGHPNSSVRVDAARRLRQICEADPELSSVNVTTALFQLAQDHVVPVQAAAIGSFPNGIGPIPSIDLTRIGLAANPGKRDHPDSDLSRFMQSLLFHFSMESTSKHQFRVIGGTLASLRANLIGPARSALPTPPIDSAKSSPKTLDRVALDANRDPIYALPYGRHGGLRILAQLADEGRLDALIYLMDPGDPSIAYAEADGLKRTCARVGVPLITSVGAARELLRLDHYSASDSRYPGPKPVRLSDPSGIALICDRRSKVDLASFFGRHPDTLASFEQVYASESTIALVWELCDASNEWQVSESDDEDVVIVRRSGSSDIRLTPLPSTSRTGLNVAELIADQSISHTLIWESDEPSDNHRSLCDVVERAGQVPKRSYHHILFRGKSAIECWAARFEIYRRELPKDVEGPQRQLAQPLQHEGEIRATFGLLEEEISRRFAARLILTDNTPPRPMHQFAGLHEQKEEASAQWIEACAAAADYMTTVIQWLQRVRHDAGERVRIGVGWGRAMVEIVSTFEKSKFQLLVEHGVDVSSLPLSLTGETEGVRQREMWNSKDAESILVLELLGTMAAPTELSESRQVAANLSRSLGGTRRPFGLLGAEVVDDSKYVGWITDEEGRLQRSLVSGVQFARTPYEKSLIRALWIWI